MIKKSFRAYFSFYHYVHIKPFSGSLGTAPHSPKIRSIRSLWVWSNFRLESMPVLSNIREDFDAPMRTLVMWPSLRIHASAIWARFCPRPHAIIFPIHPASSSGVMAPTNAPMSERVWAAFRS